MKRYAFLALVAVTACSSIAFAFNPPPPGGGGPGSGGSPPTANINSHVINWSGGAGNYSVSATATFTASCPVNHIDDEEILVWSDIDLAPVGFSGEQNFQIYAGQTTTWTLSTGTYNGPQNGWYTSTAELDVVDFNLANPDWVTAGPSIINAYVN